MRPQGSHRHLQKLLLPRPDTPFRAYAPAPCPPGTRQNNRQIRAPSPAPPQSRTHRSRQALSLRRSSEGSAKTPLRTKRPPPSAPDTS